ncbi:unnamed protein product [Amoebophrya sp. A25]|nr:unnamed protein product [Amoebophrya sp. A25]|eukprot:GSA25T00026193001.1
MAIAETSKLAAGVGVVQKGGEKNAFTTEANVSTTNTMGKNASTRTSTTPLQPKPTHARLRLCTAGKIGDERPVMTAARRLYDRMGFQPTGEVEHDPWGGMTQD